MPFDGTKTEPDLTTRLGRLEVLYEIAMKASGDQTNWCHCLWHDCCRDGRLISAGLVIGHRPTPWSEDFNKIGAHTEIHPFGNSPLEEKRRAIAAEIEWERARMGGVHDDT